MKIELKYTQPKIDYSSIEPEKIVLELNKILKKVDNLLKRYGSRRINASIDVINNHEVKK